MDGQRHFQVRFSRDGESIGEGKASFFFVHGEGMGAIHHVEANFGEDSERVLAVLERTLEEALTESHGRVRGSVDKEFDGHQYKLELEEVAEG